MLESLMHITINGPEVQECESLVKKAVKTWHEVKARRKIAKSIPANETSSNCPKVLMLLSKSICCHQREISNGV